MLPKELRGVFPKSKPFHCQLVARAKGFRLNFKVCLDFFLNKRKRMDNWHDKKNGGDNMS
jgi:hypothetical protein